jgi:diguanylate cyclase (GGDEF)-like protein
MSSIGDKVLVEALRHALDGAAVIDPRKEGLPVLYVNSTLAALLDREEKDTAGLEMGDLETGSLTADSLTSASAATRVRLKAGGASEVPCERTVVALSDDKLAVFYRPVPRATAGAAQSAFERSTGMSTPEHLLEVLRRDWSIAKRDGRTITVMRFNVDFFLAYSEVFGRGAADAALRQVARTIASAMRRKSDVVARVGDDEFVVLAVSMQPENALQYADAILQRIRALSIHHPRSPAGRFLTASAGVATISPPRKMDCETVLEATKEAMAEAKSLGGNRAAAASLEGAAG